METIQINRKLYDYLKDKGYHVYVIREKRGNKWVKIYKTRANNVKSIKEIK